MFCLVPAPSHPSVLRGLAVVVKVAGVGAQAGPGGIEKVAPRLVGVVTRPRGEGGREY